MGTNARDCVQQGSCTQAYMDVFTACLGHLSPLVPGRSAVNFGSIRQEYVRNAGSNTSTGYANLGSNKQETKNDRHPD